MALHATLFVTGAAVMALEVLGARVIGPHFGATLYVWTALIAVTLLALAGGYWVGGALADRGATGRGLHRLVALAGALVLLIPVERATAISVASALGLRAGTLVASGLLFFPALSVLGCVTPYATKLHTASLDAVGRSVGGLYAVSTLGSFAGAVGTGFFLIPNLKVTHCLHLVGGVLVALGLLLALARIGRATSIAVALAALSSAAHASHAATRPTPLGLVHAETSHYGDIRVVDHGASRTLLVDSVVMTQVDRATGEPVPRYPGVIVSETRRARPGATRAVLFGLGGGPIARDLEARGVVTDSVEIDPAVVSVARRFFGFAPRGEVHVADARTFIAAPPRRYGIAVIDAYVGERIPVHLSSLEVFGEVRDRVLEEGGVLAVNVVGFSRGHLSPGVEAFVRTLRGAFTEVRAIPSGLGAGSEAFLWNVVLLASSGPLPASGLAPLDVSPGPVLTDDWNPLDTLDAGTRRHLRALFLASLPPGARAAALDE